MWFALISSCGLCVSAQEPQQQPDAAPATQHQTPVATVHGVVRNIASGAPLPRALVRVSGDANTGALTDGEGRFEIFDVPVGAQEFEVIKPGFVDELAQLAGASSRIESRNFAHNAIVELEMPDLVFAMTPTNAIRGQILLSTGEPAEGIGVSLLKQTVQNGRASWATQTHVTTNSEGAYRFGSLTDGTYVVVTDPAMDTESPAALIANGGAAKESRGGYASQFYSQAHDLAGAARIQLQGGTTAEADLSLTLEPFHSVTASLLLPAEVQPRQSAPGTPGVNYGTIITDSEGHQLPYTAQYDQAAHTMQAWLPDGSYTLLASAAVPRTARSGNGPPSVFIDRPSFAGSVDFSVAGRWIGNLRIPLAEARPTPVEVNLVRSNAASSQSSTQVVLTITQSAGSPGDIIPSVYAEGRIDAALKMTYSPPGQYWVDTNLTGKQVCESSLTAGGVNLALEPLTIGSGGSTPPVSLTLRDDCASLTLNLPAALSTHTAGEEPFLTVYVVPDFDSTVDVIPETLRPSTGGAITLHALTPGSYHVYSFDKPMALAYRNKDVLSALADHAQPVELSPGSTASLVLEVPKS